MLEYEISIQSIREVRGRIKNKIVKTPCLLSNSLKDKFNKNIFLKLENLQITHAFKIRGNTNKIDLLSRNIQGNKSTTFITASSGNHGQGLSLAAFKSGFKSIIVVPDCTPNNKIDSIRRNNGEVIIKGTTYDEASDYAYYLAAKNDYKYIPSFDDLDIIAGNGTAGLEIMEEIPECQVIICPIGGGGGISGIALAAKQINPSIKIIGVQAQGAPSMARSFQENRIIELKNINTFAEGIAVKKPGEITFLIIKKYVDDIVTVSDEAIKNAMKYLAFETKIIVEAAGSSPIAAILENKINLSKFSNVVCFISGGNVGMLKLMEILKPLI
jgi:threonine dehydratase